jgi:hypothetical protein
MVTLTLPGVAVPAAARDSTLVDVVLEGLKLAVTPEESPDADRFTEPVKPFSGVTVMVLVLLRPCRMLMAEGDAESENSGTTGAFTVRVRVVVRVNVPETPVIVSITIPVAAVLAAVSVSVLAEVVLVGLKLAVTPNGSPLTNRLTDPLNPFIGFTAMVLVAMFPCVMVNEPGAAESVTQGSLYPRHR